MLGQPLAQGKAVDEAAACHLIVSSASVTSVDREKEKKNESKYCLYPPTVYSALHGNNDKKKQKNSPELRHGATALEISVQLQDHAPSFGRLLSPLLSSSFILGRRK